jgi:hypothetical protein
MPATSGMVPIARKASCQATTAVPITGGFSPAMAALTNIKPIIEPLAVASKDAVFVAAQLTEVRNERLA